MTERNLFTTADEARRFIGAGNATVTLCSKTTGTRFTFKIQAPMNDDGTSREPNKPMRFVKVLTGQDNENSYSYLGYIKTSPAGDVYYHGGVKAKVGVDAPSAKAFAWVWQQLVRNKLPDVLEIWHEGRCGRCGRKLTVPESIASGLGPECAQHFAATWAA